MESNDSHGEEGAQDHGLYKEVKIRDKVQIEVHDGGDFDFVDYEQLWATMLNSVHCECGETFYKDENAVEHLIEVGEFDG